MARVPGAIKMGSVGIGSGRGFETLFFFRSDAQPFRKLFMQTDFGAVRMLREVGELIGRRDIRCFGRSESQNFGEARQVIGILLDVETEILQRQAAVPDAFHERMLHAGCPDRFDRLADLC